MGFFCLLRLITYSLFAIFGLPSGLAAAEISTMLIHCGKVLGGDLAPQGDCRESVPDEGEISEEGL